MKKSVKFLPYDKRVRIDEITSKHVRDIMRYTGAKSEGEAIRNAVVVHWNYLQELELTRIALLKKVRG